MTVNDIIKAQEVCYINDRESCEYCVHCPMFDNAGPDCQEVLARLTIEKLTEMRDLIDDKVNHHYYDTLEFYQEENAELRGKLEAIEEILCGRTK